MGNILDAQHGFMLGRSMCQVDVVYANFAEAFESLDHGILLYKLSKFGISDPLCLLQSSSLLFLAFINDLPRCLTCECLMFTDDVRLFLAVAASR